MEQTVFDFSCIYRHHLRDHIINGDVVKLVDLHDWTFYKARVNGKMTAQNVNTTCQEYGLTTMCYQFGREDATYNTPQCPIIKASSSLKYTFKELSKAICGNYDADKCTKLHELFIFMKEWNSGAACGNKVPGSYCHIGTKYSNKFALCGRGILNE